MTDVTVMIYALSLVGAAVSAVSGALAAGRKRFDLIGVAVLAVVTAVGGGTLRDVLLDRKPFWIADPTVLWVVLITAMATIIYVKFFKPPYTALLIADALGLALFTISGAQLAEQQLLPGLIVVVMATMTGTAGGVLRDVLSAEVPLLFQRKETLYATAAIAGSSVYLLIQFFGVSRTIAAFIGMIVVVALRFAAIAWRLQLPEFQFEDEASNPRD